MDITNSFRITYLRNKPSLGQGKNVDNLILNVETPLFILLHDDNLFLENCLKDLYHTHKNNGNTDIVFAKQYLMDNDTQMIPSNFYLTETKLAKEIAHESHATVTTVIDFHLLLKSSPSFFYGERT